MITLESELLQVEHHLHNKGFLERIRPVGSPDADAEICPDWVSAPLDLELLLDSMPNRAAAGPEAAPARRLIPEGRNPRAFVRLFLSEYLGPVCERAELSGWFRRREAGEFPLRTPEMDFVGIPKGCGAAGFAWKESRLYRFLLRYHVLTQGGGIPLRETFEPGVGLNCYRFVAPVGVVRVWVTTAERFGITLLLTTGPRVHLVALSLRARSRGGAGLLSAGLYTANHRLLSAEEDEIYAGLGLGWIAPRGRCSVILEGVESLEVDESEE